MAVLALVAGDAAAHTFEPALLDFRERESGTFDVVWRPPRKESGAVLPGAPPLVPRLPAACRPVSDLGAGDEWTATRVACGTARLHGETIAVPGIAGGRVDAIVRISWNDGQATSGVLTDASEAFVVPEGPRGILEPGAPLAAIAGRYLELGIEHILGGTDHVLFVVGLFLLVGATRALVATVSAFTIAHSLTLAAAVLGVVTVPPPPVEALIAASIVLLARELLRDAGEPATLTRRFPWLMAFAFGLLHGLGFAGALAETGVPGDQIPLALVAFNVGVEVGQLAIVGLLIGVAAAAPRALAAWPGRRWLPAYGLGAVSSAWMIERILRFWAT
ncbi:MAG: hypothetical protein B6D46_00165 [Polyangiaceae bacterium UTPRO1]|jgi:hydrogenase/urease accessory protein HupE|nr:MAG: hypothetical protein B6D46_00165 [Polyangiaceae bacterium UTPRO1]